MRSTDVLIVGGGPAGLLAGVVLAEDGLRTLVVERRSLPAGSPCGEGILPTGRVHLEELGVLAHLPPDAGRPLVGITYHGPRGARAEGTFAEGPGLGLSRLDLSRALLGRARATPGLRVRDGVAAIPRERGPRGTVVEAGDDLVRARLLVGADGLRSRVRSFVGLDRPPGPAARFGASRHLAVAPWTERVEVRVGEGLEAYVTPAGPGAINLAFLWDRDRLGSLPGRGGLFPRLLEAFPGLRRRVGGAPRIDDVRACGPLHRPCPSPVGDGVVLVGDAAGYLDAITGEGISLAAAQARALSRTVAPLLRGPARDRRPRRRELRAHARAHERIVRPYVRMTRLLLALARRPRLADRFIRVLDRAPDLFADLLSASMGTVGVGEVILRRGPTLLRGLLRPRPSGRDVPGGRGRGSG